MNVHYDYILFVSFDNGNKVYLYVFGECIFYAVTRDLQSLASYHSSCLLFSEPYY